MTHGPSQTNRSDLRRVEIKQRPTPRRRPAIEPVNPSVKRLGVVSNPQGRRGISPKTLANGATAPALGTRSSPKKYVGSGTIAGPRVGRVDGAGLTPARKNVAGHSGEYKSRRQTGSAFEGTKRLRPRDYGRSHDSGLAINLNIGRHRRHETHYDHGGHYGLGYYGYYGHYRPGLTHGLYGHYPYGYNNYTYYPYYSSSYSCYSEPYYTGYTGLSLGVSLGGSSFGYSRYNYDYAYNYGQCRYGYWPRYYTSLSYMPYDYGWVDYRADYTLPVYYPAETDVYVEPADYDEDDAVLDVGFYDPFDLSADQTGYGIYGYGDGWPGWSWCRTYLSTPFDRYRYSSSHVIY